MFSENRSKVYHRLGNMIAPIRFIVFAIILIILCTFNIPILGWRIGFMTSFDLSALIFLVSCSPLLDNKPAEMRSAAKLNDANRAGLLAITGMVTLVILTAVASILKEKNGAQVAVLTLIIVTLILTWIFSNTVYAMHYAHLYYSSIKDDLDYGGLSFPETDEPNYYDFIYFSFCLGMTFQTSDVEVTDHRLRIVVTMHCFAAFMFNLGIIAFTINVLGS